MDTLVEDIALVPKTIQNQDDNIENQRDERHIFIRIFNSKKYLKQFILWIILFICLLLIAGPLALHISYALPTVKTRNIEAHIFSEERAHDYLINLTQYGPRVINTRGNFDARNYLLSQIERIASMNKRYLQIEIDLQNFTNYYYGNQLQNIIVRVSNSSTKSKNVSSLMLSAHYDSVEFSPGGSDDGAGVVILLELLSNMINDLTITFSNVHLIVLFTNAEEMGLQGATAFITHHQWRFNIRRFIYIDAVSCNEKANLMQVKTSQLVIDYSRVSRPRANVILENIPTWIGTIVDYDIYSIDGSLLGYDFGFFIDGYTYHTPLDHPLMMKQGVIQDLGDNLHTLIHNILLEYVDIQIPMNIIDNNPLIYFDILGQYLIVYKMSTSIIIQKILIILIIIVGIILIIFDYRYHRKRCTDSYCIYFYFKYPTILRILLIIIYFISNLMSIFIGLLCSCLIALIMSKIQPLSWLGNSTLAIFLFSLPYLIGFITIEYLWNIFLCFILRKWSKNSIRFNKKMNSKVNFDFEQNLSMLFIYSLLMIVSICYNARLLYIILIWSIFICPIYLILMIIEFIFHWKKIHWYRYYWLFLPLIISLLPLTHTIEIMNRLIRILIPFLARRFSFKLWSFRGNIIICSLITIPSIFFLLIFIPILQRIKQFGRILIVLLSIFFIIFLIACNRQPFTKNHPNIYYAKHISTSFFKVETLSSIPFIVPLISQSSSITILTYDGIALSPVLDEFSMKSGYILHNKQCLKSTECTFDDTFNRTIAVQNIEIQSMKNFLNYTIIIRHVLSYNIQVLSFSFIKFIIRNQLNIPRNETIIDITLNNPLFSFTIDIKIQRCDLIDSPFLVLFTRLMTNIVPMGEAQCQAITDHSILTFDL